MQLSTYSQSNKVKMNYKSINGASLHNTIRVVDLNMLQPKISAEFFVRLFSLLNTKPEENSEGYEFFIKDIETGLEFSAALTGFGAGYFAEKKSKQVVENIKKFNDLLFNYKELKECKIEIGHDFGKSILGYENGKIIEIEIEE